MFIIRKLSSIPKEPSLVMKMALLVPGSAIIVFIIVAGCD